MIMIFPLLRYAGLPYHNTRSLMVLSIATSLGILAQLWIIIFGVRKVRISSRANPLLLSTLVAGAGQSLQGFRSWALFLNFSLLFTSMTCTFLQYFTGQFINYAEQILSLNSYTRAYAGIFDRYELLNFAALAIVWGPLYFYNIWDCRQRNDDAKKSVIEDLFIIVLSFLVPGSGNAYTKKYKSAFTLLALSFLGALLLNTSRSEGLGWMGLYLCLGTGLIGGVWGGILIVISQHKKERAKLVVGIIILAGLIFGIPLLKSLNDSRIEKPFSLMMDLEGNLAGNALTGGGKVCRLNQGGYAITRLEYDKDKKTSHIQLSVIDVNGNILSNTEVLSGAGCSSNDYISQTSDDELLIFAGEIETSHYRNYNEDVPEKLWMFKTDLAGNMKSKCIVAQWPNMRQIYYISCQPGGALNIVCSDNHKNEYTPGSSKIAFVKVDPSGNQTVTARTAIDSLPKPPVFIRTNDGNYICAASDKIMLHLLDSDGNQIKEISFAKDFEAADLQQTSDGGFIIAGNTFRDVNHFELRDLVVAKVDSSGYLQWQQRYNAEKTFDNSGYGRVNTITELPDGKYMLLSNFGFIAKNSLEQPNYLRLLKLDINGEKLWEKNLGRYGAGKKLIIKSFDDAILITGQ